MAAVHSPPGGFSDGQLGSALYPAALSIRGYGGLCWGVCAKLAMANRQIRTGNSFARIDGCISLLTSWPFLWRNVRWTSAAIILAIEVGDIQPPPLADAPVRICLLYTSDAADERSSVDLGGRRI